VKPGESFIGSLGDGRRSLRFGVTLRGLEALASQVDPVPRFVNAAQSQLDLSAIRRLRWALTAAG
jgi:hypothetical protein